MSEREGISSELLTLSAEAGNRVAAGVDDGVVGHAVLLQERCEGAVQLLVRKYQNQYPIDDHLKSRDW